MTETKNDVCFTQRAAITYMLITLPKQVKKLVPPIDDNLDHSYCVRARRSSKETRNCNVNLQSKKHNVDVSKIVVDYTQRSIVKEEVIISELTEENVDQNIPLDTLSSRINDTISTKKGKKTFVSSPVHDPIKITLEQYYNLSGLKPRNIEVPSVLKLSDNIEKDKSTVHLQDGKEKQIATVDNNFIEMKEEFIDEDTEEQTANRNKRFYHIVCLTCKKLKDPDDTSSKCLVCQNTFQYECLRCRDILSSQDEYHNHLKIQEFCPEIQVPLALKNDSYALATLIERNQCSSDARNRAQKLISTVKLARIKTLDGKFKRIKLCCPICDETYPVDNGNFWCVKCETSSVFNCQTCNRNYTTYCGAIYHTENHRIRRPIYECYDCSFKHKKKRALLFHIRHEHLQKQTRIKKHLRSKRAQCPDCNLIIKSNSYWMKHEYTCRKKVYFKCTLCPEKYLVKEDVRLHLLAAHEKTDCQALQLIKQIENARNRQEKLMKQKKQRSLNRSKKVEPKKKIEINNKFKLHYITPYCINCNKTYEHLKISNTSNSCPKCKSIIGVQCKCCKKFFDKYNTAYYHITKKCEKIRKDKLKGKNNGSVRKASRPAEGKGVKGNTNPVDSNNDMENNSTLETIEMFDTDIDIKIEDQDIKIFASPLNLEEVIIPDKIVH